MAVRRARSGGGAGVTVDRLNTLMAARLPGYQALPVVDRSAADFPPEPLDDLVAAAAVVDRLRS